MKNRVFGRIRKFTPVIMAIVYICIIALFTSCEGFINSKDTSRQIENYIEYANSQSYHITIKDSDGNGTIKAPVGGETYKKVTDTFTINYGPFEDYEFLCWKIIDGNTKQEFPNGEYLTITSITDKETECTFTKAPGPGVELCLVPEVVARPETLLKSPAYKSIGVNWDSRIFVQFDKDMDPNSIYYTEPEYEAKKVELGITEEIDSSDIDPDHLDANDNVFLCVDKNENPKRYYGYIKDGETVFKNIQITNYSNTSENLLKYFKAPRFEDSKRLSISPITKKVNDKNQPVLGSGKTIFVTLDKNFYYSASIGENNSKPITMRKPVSWNYLLNDKLDGTGPIVSTVSIQDMNGNYVPTSSSSDPCYLNNSKKLKLYIAVQDDDSGPASDFKMLLTKIGETETKEIKIKYENADGNYATSGNSQDYYECVIDDIPSDVDGDYEFNLQFYDNSENYYTGEESTKTYYVSIDTQPPEVTGKTIETCDSSNNQKTAIKLNYNTSDSHFAGGKVWYRRAVPTSDANWDEWNPNPDDTLDKNNTSKIIDGLDFGTTYEFKTVYYDEAGNATKPYYFKRTTKPQAFNSSLLTVEKYEDARCIKITTTENPAGADTVKLVYTTGSNFGINEKSNTYNTTTKEFFIRNIDYGKTYQIKLSRENSERIDDSRYENCDRWNDLSNKVETVIAAQKTKPKGVTVNVGSPVYNSSSKKFKYTFTITGTKGSVTGVKYKYGYYKSDGSLYYPSDSNYSGKITPTGNETNFSLSQNFNLDPSKRYHFIFESYYYYGNEDYVCDPIVKKEFDFWTPASEVEYSSIKCETKTTTTAKLVWEKPEGDFSHYKIVWFKDGDFSNRLAAYVPKDKTSFTITNLLKTTKYYAYVFCCSNKNECYINENGVSYKDFYTTNVISDVPFKINKISIYNADNSSAINCKLDVKISDNGYSGTFQSVTAKWVAQNNNETYTSLLNRLKSSSNNVTLNTSSGHIEMKTLSSSLTYYLQFFDNNSKAVSDVFAVRPAWEVNDSYYYLKEYSYECKSNNRVDLTIKWNTSFYGTINYIRWKKTGTLPSNNNWKYQNYTHQSTITLEDNNTSPFTPGSTFDVEFCTNNNSSTGGTVYAAAFITIQETPETVFAENLTASKWSYDSVTLNWAQNNDCDYYNVYYRNSTLVMAADQISKETPFVTIRGLSLNTDYRFVVVCHTSGIADTITINDWNNKGITQKTNEKNIYVNSVEQIAAGQNFISLKCTNVQHNNVSDCIKVYYKSEDETEWNSKTFSSYNFSLSNLTPGTKYEIKAVALSEAINDIVQESFPATCVAYTSPNKPSFPSSFTKTSSSIFAFWYFPNGKWSKALLSYSSGGAFIPLKVIDYEDRNESESRYYNLENLEPGKTYTFRLECFSDEEMTYESICSINVTTNSQ